MLHGLALKPLVAQKDGFETDAQKYISEVKKALGKLKPKILNSGAANVRNVRVDKSA